jgi:hypothetical protein
MNEHELRETMRTTMATVTAPPPMSETPVLNEARRELRRTRARWAGAASAVAVAAIVAGAAFVTATPGNDGPSPVRPGGGVTDDPADTQTSWPNGQQDRTATSGPEFDKGQALLDGVTAIVPPAFGAPRDLRYEEPGYSGPLRFSQSQYVDTVDGTEVWEYEGVQPVTQGNGVGELAVIVTTPGNGMAGDGCALSPTMWGMTGTCEEHDVDGKRVGVFTAKGASVANQFDSWAGYRYVDGTVVFIAQDNEFDGSAKSAVSEPPLSPERLAELVTDPRFHLD